GVVLNVLLYGIMITQTYLYFAVYRHDRVWIKCLVGLLFFADTLNTVLLVRPPYKRPSYSSLHFTDNPAELGITNWASIPTTTGSFTEVGGLGTSIACGIVTEFRQFHKFQAIVIAWLVSAAVADVAIATVMVFHLRAHRTGIRSTDDIITRLSRMIVSTGAITAMCATADLVAFLTSTSGLHLLFNTPLAKLYTNSLLSS
ncbi:hypothetical protein PUNSTDRAFT_25514, partial [Punctularia strigosozonata HHB-11173 SS5]|uniref:uncharacterized protein n=1 Tax=Punctularia strigosozonata (strain HHB-11173) TaxID=741275 RepID=UPI000441746E